MKADGRKAVKKKRLIAPIRIKLTKMPVNKNLQKSLVRLKKSVVASVLVFK